MAGLFAANLLLRSGWSVVVLERTNANLDARGAGIATHDELFDAMRKAGATVDALIGIQVQGRAAYDASGQAIAESDHPQYLTSWGLIYRRLRAAFPTDFYRLGQSVVDVIDGEDHAEVILADGTRHAADLVIGADGSWSTVRQRCAPTELPRYCGYVAWRGLIHEMALPAVFQDRYARFLNFFTDEDQQLICAAVAGTDDSVVPGHRRFSFLLYRPYDAESELPSLLTDDESVRHQYQIPPTKISSRHIARLHDEAASMLPPDFSLLIRSVERPFLQPIYDMIPNQIAFRHVALIGDAACIARPHVGAGVAKAAVDAAALAEILNGTDGVTEALQAFQLQRQPLGAALVERGRRLGSYLERPRSDRRHVAPLPTAAILSDSAALVRNPPAVTAGNRFSK